MSPPLIVFSHGNSFPASTYGVMLDALRQRGFRVEAIEKLGHHPGYPVSDNWPALVQELTDFVRPLAANAPVLLVGHSLGGLLSTMVAAESPQWVRGVVLLDSPLIGGWRAQLLRLSKRWGFIGSVSPASVSHKRRTHWANQDEALAHFQHKRVFAQWDPQVLRDYVAFGTHDEVTAGGTRRVLSFDRETESAIYNTLPDHLEQLFKRHPLRCKVALIAGLASREIRHAGLGLSRRLTQGRITMVDGSHLFPMERPLMAAACVEAAVLNLMG